MSYYFLILFQKYRLHEFDKQAAAIREGIATVVPLALLVRDFCLHVLLLNHFPPLFLLSPYSLGINWRKWFVVHLRWILNY